MMYGLLGYDNIWLRYNYLKNLESAISDSLW